MDHLEIIRSQYLAALEMLKHAIGTCPPAVWNDPADQNRSWYVAYHALYFTHYYLQDLEDGFEVWQGHWDERDPGAPDMNAGYTQADLLDYLSFCQEEVNRLVPSLNPEAAAGFARRQMNKFELQVYSIRHIMQHAGELMERNGTRAGVEGIWVGMMHDEGQMRMKRAYAFSLMRQLLPWAAVLGVLGGLFFGMQAGVRDSGEWVARLMAPPIYPGSVLVDYQRTNMPGYVLEVTTYETTDDYQRVVDYISDHYTRLRGRSQRASTTRTGFSPLNLADFIGQGPTVRPKTSIGVFGSANLARTNIRVIVIWPVAGGPRGSRGPAP